MISQEGDYHEIDNEKKKIGLNKNCYDRSPQKFQDDILHIVQCARSVKSLNYWHIFL